MATLKVTETIVYYDGDLLNWGESEGIPWLVLYIEDNLYLCVPVEGIDLHETDLRTVFKTARHTIDVTETWEPGLCPIETVPDDWLPSEGAYLYDFIEEESND